MCGRTFYKGMRSNKRGAALVEFAIVALLLFTLVFGIIDFGLLLKSHLALSQVAREGARSAGLGYEDYDVRAKCVDWANKLGLQNFDPSKVQIERTEPDPGGQVTVIIEYEHSMVTGLFGNQPRTLRTTMVMRRE